MYSVLLVDDDPVVKIKIKSIIDWNALGFEINDEPCNGFEALKLIEANDYTIIITDITMPKMNGLEFIDRIKQLGSTAEIIVLSGYNEYDFVRQSFKYGVVDYLLKSDINSDNIVQLLDKCMANLKQKNIQKDETNISNKVFKKHVLEQLISKSIGTGIYEQIKTCGLQIHNENIILAIFCIDNYKILEDKMDFFVMQNLLNSILSLFDRKQNEFKIGEILKISNKKYLYIMSFKDEASLGEILRKSNIILKSIIYDFKQFYNLSVTCGISDVFSGYENINNAYHQAEKAIKMKIIYGCSNIITQQLVYNVNHHDVQISKNIVANLVKNIGEDETQINIELETIKNIISKLQISDIKDAYSLFENLTFMTTNLLAESGIKMDDLFSSGVNFCNEFMNMETIEEMEFWYESLIRKVNSMLREQNDSKSQILEKAIKFIKIHYCDTISLKVVSDYCNISESHLSKLFSTYKQYSFIQLVTSLRIEKAKSLIREKNKSIGEICEEVGYENQEHFSRVFKKMVGVSPKKFI